MEKIPEFPENVEVTAQCVKCKRKYIYHRTPRFTPQCEFCFLPVIVKSVKYINSPKTQSKTL